MRVLSKSINNQRIFIPSPLSDVDVANVAQRPHSLLRYQCPVLRAPPYLQRFYNHFLLFSAALTFLFFRIVLAATEHTVVKIGANKHKVHNA